MLLEWAVDNQSWEIWGPDKLTELLEVTSKLVAE